MTKIIIVDYLFEIVIAIINYDEHNLHWMMFIPLFEATAFYVKINKLKTFKQKVLLIFCSIKPQMSTIHWICFFFKLLKNIYMHLVL